MKPSGSSASPIRRASRRAARDRVREVVVGDLEQVGGVVARDHQRVTRGRRVDVHEGDRVLVGVDDLGRAPRRRRSRRRCSRHRARSLFARSIACSAVDTSPVKTAASTSPSSRPSSGPGSIPSSAASSSPAIGDPRRAVAVPGERRGQHLARQLEVRLDHLRGRGRAGAAGREPVGDREQGDVGGDRLGQLQVVVEAPPRERPLAGHEPEVQVVQRQRLEVARERPARLQPRASLANDQRAGRGRGRRRRRTRPRAPRGSRACRRRGGRRRSAARRRG